MEEGETNNRAEKADDPKKEDRLHLKQVKGPRDSMGEDNLIEKKVEEATMLQFHPSAPPQPTMVQVKTHCDCAVINEQCQQEEHHHQHDYLCKDQYHINIESPIINSASP